MNLKNIWLWLFIGSLISSCQSAVLIHDGNLVALATLDPQKTYEYKGLVRAKKCAIRVFGFGPFAELTPAFDQLKQTEGLSYLTRVRIERKSRNYIVWELDCWEIRGLGYR